MGNSNLEGEAAYKHQVIQEFIQAIQKLAMSHYVGFDIHEGDNQDNGYIVLKFSSDVNRYEITQIPDFILLIACLWRIETADSVLGTFTGSKNGVMNRHNLSALRELITGDTLKNIDLIQPSFDLKIEFTRGYMINVMVGGMSGYLNYRLFCISKAVDENHNHSFDVEENGRVNYLVPVPPE